MGVVEFLVAVHFLICRSVHYRCLQVQLVDFGTGSGQQLPIELVEVQVGEEDGRIVLQDVGPCVSRQGFHQIGKVEVVAHLERKGSRGLEVRRHGFLVVKGLHVDNRNGSYGKERDAQRRKHHGLKPVAEVPVAPFSVFFGPDQPDDE